MALIWDSFWPLVTAVLAVYGAVLSSFNTWHNYRRDRIKISIKSEVEKDVKNEVEYYLLKLSIINRSNRPVTITEMGFMSTDGERLTFQKKQRGRNYDNYLIHNLAEPPDSELPKKLLISDKVDYYRLTATVLLDKNDFVQSRILIPYGVDSEGNIYKGLPVTVTIDHIAMLHEGS